MFNAPTAVAIIGFIMGAVGFLVYLLGTVKKGKNDVLRQDNIDLRASNDTLRQEKANRDQIILSQKETIAGLKDVATQTPAVNKLIELITTQQQLQTQQQTEIIKKLSELGSELSALAKAINKSHTGK